MPEHAILWMLAFCELLGGNVPAYSGKTVFIYMTREFSRLNEFYFPSAP